LKLASTREESVIPPYLESRTSFPKQVLIINVKGMTAETLLLLI
jgi:hypothetical protein